ncbi:MAG TPA: sigma-70 family RNA polymerase sigma factor [Polyangiaceae bacterium]|jgi:RNA polymerase sigma-70 factor (ECF subfamily)
MDPPQDVLELLSRAVRSERARLAAIARREGLGEEDAVDCVHDAFCTFLQRAIRGDLPDETERRAYLAGIVKNAARNKRRRHHVARPHDPLDEHRADAAEIAPDERIARAEEHVRLRACVERLCDTQRAVVTLRMLEERDGEDVAAALGITRGHVDVLLHRARGALFACMTE